MSCRMVALTRCSSWPFGKCSKSLNGSGASFDPVWSNEHCRKPDGWTSSMATSFDANMLPDVLDFRVGLPWRHGGSSKYIAIGFASLV